MAGIAFFDELQGLEFPSSKVIAAEKDNDVRSNRLVGNNKEVRGISDGTGDYDDREDNC